MTLKSGIVRLTPPVSERDHRQGLDSAPVTLVEYGDYECPYCGMAHPIVRDIQRHLGNQLRFVFRHFPLMQMHLHAQHAAEAAEAAGTQGTFWEMHDTLFEHQQALDNAHLVLYATSLGLERERFAREVVAHVYVDRIREDLLSGERSGVNGTPTFFINGVRYDKSYDRANLFAAIKAAMDS